MTVSVTDLEVLLTNAVKNIRALGSDLEEPSGSTAGGILRGEEESEDGLGDLVVGELAEKRSRLFKTLGGTGSLGLAPLLGVQDGLDPAIHDTGNITSSSHAHLALGGALGELGDDHVGRLLAVPGLGVGKNDGEVDQFESLSDEEVVGGDLANGLVRDVEADKGAAGNGRHEITEMRHEGNRLVASVLGGLQELLEVLLVNLLLTGQVRSQGLASEEAVESLTEVDMGLAVEEHPVGGAKELVGGVDNAGLNVSGGVEDLTGHITS